MIEKYSFILKFKVMAHKKTVHHRKPRSIGGTDDTRNLSYITDRKHKAWHTLFQNKRADQIVWELNNVYLDPDYVVVLKEKKKADPNQLKLFVA